MAHLGAGDMPMDAFLSLIARHAWPDDALLVAFTPAEARFDRFRHDVAFLMQTDQGRIFSSAGELRWRKIGSTMRVVFLGPGAAPEGLADHTGELAGLSVARRHFLLWGERTDSRSEWIEQQVPGPLAYPIETAVFPKGRAALEVEEWRDSAGISRFSRYFGIIEVKGDENNATG
jgi:hypothetical protein